MTTFSGIFEVTTFRDFRMIISIFGWFSALLNYVKKKYLRIGYFQRYLCTKRPWKKAKWKGEPSFQRYVRATTLVGKEYIIFHFQVVHNLHLSYFYFADLEQKVFKRRRLQNHLLRIPQSIAIGGKFIFIIWVLLKCTCASRLLFFILAAGISSEDIERIPLTVF